MYSQTCNYNSTNYVVVPKVGQALGNLMKMLTAYGAVPHTNFHVIGFLHGAHIAGIAGKDISPLRISRISGKLFILMTFKWEKIIIIMYRVLKQILS